MKMKFNRGSFLLLFVLILNSLINNVASSELEFEAETESVQTTLPTLEGDEINNDENNSDEIASDGMDTSSLQISTEQISPIIDQLLSPLSTTIQPYLGPLAPLSNVLSSIISHTVTELVVNLLNETVSTAKRQEFLQIRNYTSYTSYLVTVPKNGRFLLLTKTRTTYRKSKRSRCT